MFFEILTILGQTIWGLLSALFSVIWNNLPEILEIKKVLGYFTPAGAVAIYLGVPTIVVIKSNKSATFCNMNTLTYIAKFVTI